MIYAVLLTMLQMQAVGEPVSFGSSGQPISYVVLGDSTAAGVGAPYDDGIAVQTAKHLALTRQVTIRNFGVSGARMRDVVEKQLLQAELVKPDLVLLSAAANDVTHLTSISKMRGRLQEVVRRLRVANPRVLIVVTGSPDMGSPPRIPWILRGIASMRTKMVNRMFRSEATKLHLVFAPIAEKTGPLFRRDRTLFDADRFHPNTRGYATWVAVLNESLGRALKGTVTFGKVTVPLSLLPAQNRIDRVDQLNDVEHKVVADPVAHRHFHRDRQGDDDPDGPSRCQEES